MKKVQIYALEFGYGGVEREVITLANSLVNIYNIELIFMSKNYGAIPYKINNKIKIIYVNEHVNPKVKIKNIIEYNLNKFFKTILTENVDTVISTNVFFNKYIEASPIKNKIYWEHNHHDNSLDILNNVLEHLTNFKTIVVPTKKLENFYKDNTKVNVQMIPNLVELNGDLTSKLDNKRLISVGKLKDEKGFEKLIEVMKIVNREDKSIKLAIIGDGKNRQKLEAIVAANHLTRFISFYGVLEKSEIMEEYLNSSLFVMCSEKDSFCLSLMEAMTVGLPAVAFYEESLCDVINNDINGYLVEDSNIELMAEKILSIMNDDEFRKNLGNCAKETAIFYDVNKLKSEWIKII